MEDTLLPHDALQFGRNLATCRSNIVHPSAGFNRRQRISIDSVISTRPHGIKSHSNVVLLDK
jgi:hypothetical protein